MTTQEGMPSQFTHKEETAGAFVLSRKKGGGITLSPSAYNNRAKQKQEEKK